MNTITRKTMLYKTSVEYGNYTMNHVLGCAHGCKYPCYAFLMKKRFRQVSSYGDWCEPKLVANTLELLDKEIPRLKNKIESVFLCFSTDPFMHGYPEISEMSLAAIHKLNDHGIKCCVLTKGILPVELADLSTENEYGISLISLHEPYREVMEPNAAPYTARIEALRRLHEAGCKTWISMEPYPTPNIIEQSLAKIVTAVSFADKIIFGRTNYSKAVTNYPGAKTFYNFYADQVKMLCEHWQIDCYVKKGTLT